MVAALRAVPGVVAVRRNPANTSTTYQVFRARYGDDRAESAFVGPSDSMMPPESTEQVWLVDAYPFTNPGFSLPFDTVAAVLRIWAVPGPWTPQRALAMGAELAGIVLSEDYTLAQALFSRDSYQHGLAVPQLPDGRFEFAGVTESYPGAWPETAVVRAQVHGDLTSLWPYLAPDSGTATLTSGAGESR